MNKPLSIIIFISTLLLIANQLHSKEVDPTIAKNVALNLYAERAENPKSDNGISQVFEQKEKGETVFYVLTYSDIGFALVAADDVVKPILGYSFESNWDENNHAPAFEFFILKRFKKQIYESKHFKASSNASVSSEWDRLSKNPAKFQTKSTKSSTPLIQTHWHQRWPYNAHCPADPDGPSGHVVVGCVAVAMAQVLNYWQHPWHGQGSHSYTPEDHPEYGTQSVNFSDALYNFDNMPDDATNYSEDLAELMYHCAVSVDMNFGPDGSGAWPWGNNDVRDALQDHFRFSESGNDLNRSSYTTNAWRNKMKENLDADRPVIYAGHDYDNDAGHAWVLDAYVGDDFHCNWGWGGQDDGWFSIDNFSPEIMDRHYDNLHHASVTIYPKTSHVSGFWSLANSPYYINHSYYIDANDQLIIEPGVEIISRGRHKFIVRGQILAPGTISDSIFFIAEDPTIGWAGLRFENTNNSSLLASLLQYCSFKNGMAFRNDMPGVEYLKGGAIYCENSEDIIISHCLFTNNKAPGYGGSIACVDNSNIDIEDCTISYSEGSRGGGIYVFESDLSISGCNIHNNTAEESGGGLYVYNNSEVALNNNEFHSNNAQYGGGLSLSDCIVTLDSVTVYENTAECGGAMLIYQSSAELTNCLVFENTATHETGGIQGTSNSDILISKLINYENTGKLGGGLGVWDCYLNMDQSVIYGNTASTSGSGVFMDESHTLIRNTIIWGDATDQVYSYSGNHNINYSIVKGGFDGVGNLDSDPLIIDSENHDFHLTWESFPFPDNTKSPCIDAGDPLADPDPDGTRLDIGFFPYEQTYTPIPAGGISGTLSCADSPYYINGDVTVPLGSELIIEPCVNVAFRGNFQFIVNGRLLAEGTETDQISFFATDTIEGWKGIQFNNQDSNGQDSSILKNCRVMFGNTGTYGNGGAITLSASSEVRIENCLIAKNQTPNNGGGIYGSSSHALLKNNTIINNSAGHGGGIYSYSCQFKIMGGTIANNTAESGGGIYFYGNDPELHGVTIRENYASEFGGGICFFGNVNAVFGSSNRCNIYDNYALLAGTDICGEELYESVTIDLYLDTLTVLHADDHFIYPGSRFTKDVLVGKYPQFAYDLYVSPQGNDANAGTTPNDPLKTISRALLTICPEFATGDSLTIHLENGYYSNTLTDESFPLNWRSNVNLAGTHYLGITLDGDSINNLFRFYDDHNCLMSNISMQSGYADFGGAIYIGNQATPHFDEIQIYKCESEFDGGGIYSCDDASLTLTNSSFYHNSGRNGGGLSLYSSHASLENVSFWGNHGYNAGALYVSFSDKTIIDECVFTFNDADLCGGACNFYRSDSVVINNSRFEGNVAISQYGGALYLQESDVTFNNCSLDGNKAAWGGGAIGFYHTVNLNLNNVSITNDTADHGGGIYGQLWSSMSLRNVELSGNNAIIGSSYNGEGGAIYLWDVQTEIINTTITKNKSQENGGAIYNKTGDISITNSILWQNSPDEIFLESGTTTADYSNIDGGYAGIGNLNIYPEFYDTLTYDYSLKNISLCVDAGTPDTTGLFLPDRCLGNNPRIGNGVIDMGAFEYFERMELELSVFLEGPFNGTNMNTDLTSNPELVEGIPLQQPYNIPPWNYFGSESVTSVPGLDVVDWILIELYDASDASSATPATRIGQYAAFLKNDGSIVGTDGTSNQVFSNSITQQLFVVLKHRNHLGVLSAFPLTESGDVYNYDFTTAIAQAYNSGQKNLGSGIFGMTGGDANADGTINTEDKTCWSNQVGIGGYLLEDFSLDGQVNNKDKNDIWIENNSQSSQVPD